MAAVCCDRSLGDRADRFAGLTVGIDDFVINIGNVADVNHMISAELKAQEAEQHVEHDRRTGIANVGTVINSWSAHVHADMAWVERLKSDLVRR